MEISINQLVFLFFAAVCFFLLIILMVYRLGYIYFGWFKTKRERDLNDLVENQKKLIAAIEEDAKNKKPVQIVNNKELSFIPIVDETEINYQLAIAALVDNDFYRSFFTRLKMDFVAEFQRIGKESPEYCRGKLDALSNIISKSQDFRLLSTIKNEKGAEQ